MHELALSAGAMDFGLPFSWSGTDSVVRFSLPSRRRNLDDDGKDGIACYTDTGLDLGDFGDPILQLAGPDAWTRGATCFRPELDAMMKLYGVIDAGDEEFERWLRKGNAKAEQVLHEPGGRKDELDMLRVWRDRMIRRSQRVVGTVCFERVSGLLIVTNCLQLGMQSDQTLVSRDEAHIINTIYAILFMFEMTPLVLAWLGSARRMKLWLALDLLLVSIAVLDVFFFTPFTKVEWLMKLTYIRILRFCPVIFTSRIDEIASVGQRQRLRAVTVIMWRALGAMVLLPCVWMPIMLTFTLSLRFLVWDLDVAQVAYPNHDKFHGVYPTMVALTEMGMGNARWFPNWKAMMADAEASVVAAGGVLMLFALSVSVIISPALIGLFMYAVSSTSKETRERFAASELGEKIRVLALRRTLEHVDLDANGRIGENEYKLLRKYYGSAMQYCGITRRHLKRLWRSLRREENGEVLVESFVLGYITYFGLSKNVNSFCLQAVLRMVDMEMAKGIASEEEFGDVGSRIAQKMLAQAAVMKRIGSRETDDVQAIHDVFVRLDRKHRTMLAGMLTSDLREVEELYLASPENAGTIAAVRLTVLRQEVEVTMRAACQWAAALGVEMDAAMTDQWVTPWGTPEISRERSSRWKQFIPISMEAQLDDLPDVLQRGGAGDGETIAGGANVAEHAAIPDPSGLTVEPGWGVRTMSEMDRPSHRSHWRKGFVGTNAMADPAIRALVLRGINADGRLEI